MGRKISAAFFILAFFVSLTIIKSHDGDDADVSDETIDDPVLEEDKNLNIEPQEFITPDPPSQAYFVDSFKDKSGIGNKWILSEAKKDGVDDNIAKYNGEWDIDLPENVVLKNDFGLIVKTKARHHAISSKLDRPYNFQAKKPFIVQYDVKFQNGQDCGGAYVKLLTTEKASLKNFQDKTPYSIMFGPDKCGLQVKLHFIVKFKNPKTGVVGEHQATQTDKSSLEGYFTDKKSHLYTLFLNPDGQFKIYIDQKEIASGDMLKNLEPPIVPPQEIEDPDDKKPDEWDDKEKIADPNANKPDDWNEDEPEKIEDSDAKRPDDWLEDESEYLPDEKASKPDDWDEEMDGKWEAPLVKNPKCEGVSGCGLWSPPKIKNPAYKGKWKAPLIENPNFKGKWKPRKIENPAYFEADSIYENLMPIGAVGLELWTMSDGIVFDNFLITDDKNVADNYAIGTWYVKQTAENRAVNKSTFFGSILQAANDKPWLWAVYLLVILIPIILITIFCCTGGSKDETAQRKKTDKPRPDEMDEIDDDGDDAKGSNRNETAAVDAKEKKDGDSPRKSPQKSPASSQRKPNKKEDLEDDSEEDEGGEDEEEQSKSEEEKSQTNSSPRRRARKAE